MKHRALPPAIAALCLALLILPFRSSAADTREATPVEPRTGLGWLRRADALTNIRMFGAPPFHMKVAFHAYPGIDFTPQGKSPILTGEGTYEEWWINPKQWRREVTLGSYHAVEIHADGVRKLQASSDYEPSRVLMLMNALLAPVPRFFIEGRLQENPVHWKVEHLTAGNLPFVRVSYRHMEVFGEEVRAYDFLPNGTLVRSEEDETALMTSWSNLTSFAGKLVPRHLSVQGEGLGKEMLAADVAISPMDPGAAGVNQIEGEPADPGMTLTPVELSDVKMNGPTHFEVPGSYTTFTGYPDNVQTAVTYILDRQGNAHEVELSGVRVLGVPLTPGQSMEVTRMAVQMVKAARMNRRPVSLDNSPCEIRARVTMFPERGGESR